MSGCQSILFSRQAEGIKAHRVHDVEALHALHAGDDICCRISFRMADMQALPGRIRKHVQNVVLRLVKVIRIRPEGLVFLPVLLPLLFNFAVIISHFLSSPERKTSLLLRTF